MSLNTQTPDEQDVKASVQRYVFLDQCRGYAIFGMILVNVLGEFACMPSILKHHHEGFSYADHIAPMFMFVVGIGFRMSFLKTMKKNGIAFARKRALRRYLILMGLGLVYGGFSLRVGVWDALMDIGVSGILALPFMNASAGVRLIVAGAYLGLFQCFFSYTGYGEWLIHNSINGGPLGPLSWVFILLLGTVAADAIFSLQRARMLFVLLFMTVALSVAGWMLRMEWGTMKNFWPFSQFAMTAPYPVYAAGLCFLTVFIFYIICEYMDLAFPHLTILGRNPLVLYLLQAVFVLLVRACIYFFGWLSESFFGALLSVLFVYILCYLIAHHLYVKGKVIKL